MLGALIVLTALVWWRVINRNAHDDKTASSCPTVSAGPTVPRPAQVTVAVYNGTNRAGLAGKTTASLTKLGFGATLGGNDKSPVTGVAQIRYPLSEQPAAQLLSYYFPGAKLSPIQGSTDRTVVLSLGSTYKSMATAQQVRSAMSSAHVSYAPSPAVGAPSAPAGC